MLVGIVGQVRTGGQTVPGISRSRAGFQKRVEGASAVGNKCAGEKNGARHGCQTEGCPCIIHGDGSFLGGSSPRYSTKGYGNGPAEAGAFPLLRSPRFVNEPDA